ncbi:MAG: cell division protein FtsZ [Pseudomonadota bacterium]
MDFTLEEVDELKPQITVFGVGGAGGNAVNNMIESGLTGVSFVVANTDAQSLTQSKAAERIQIGRAITQGLGAGARPEIGRASAEENLPEIVEHLKGSHMCFIAAGMGGGTGTGAAPVIARAAKEMDILTVGVVTKPFQFEGAHRMKLANQGIDELQQYVDTLIVIPNQNLFRIANERTTFSQAFELADQVLHSGVRGVTDLMLLPGLINLDFADVRSVMSEMGKAMMGTGEAEGDHRAIAAAEAAISNPLLDDVSLKGARAVLINITGGDDLTLFDVDEATNRIRNDVDPEANIIFGAVFNENMNEKVRVSVVATGIDGARPAQIQQMQIETQPRTVPDANRQQPSHIQVGTVPSGEKPSPAYENTKVSQPMFPGGSNSWTGDVSENVSAAQPQQQAPVQNANSQNMHASPEIEIKETPVKTAATETVDDIVSQINAQKTNGASPISVEKNEDTGMKSFFGFGRHKDDWASQNPDKIEVRSAADGAEAGDKKGSDDNFEIPAFLRRSLY